MTEESGPLDSVGPKCEMPMPRHSDVGKPSDNSMPRTCCDSYFTEYHVKGCGFDPDWVPLSQRTPMGLFEKLVQRWRCESVKMKSLYDEGMAIGRPNNEPFLRSCYQRYVDYDRRAGELDLAIRIFKGQV